MCPLSDDALLEWALSPRDADPGVDRHLRECPACLERSRAVAREQDLLRAALAEPPLPSRVIRGLLPQRPAPLWPRLGIAALMLVTVALGIVLARSAGAPVSHARSYRHGALAPIQADLGIVAQKIAAAREILPEMEDPRTATAYLELLSREEGLVLEGMEHYLGERFPLTRDQELELHRAVQDFDSLLWGGGNPAEASTGFRDRMQTLLSHEQYLAFEEFSRQGTEWQWRTAISLLMEDISEELDLRFSEAEKVRRALESNYPRADLAVLRADHCPPDPLVENPMLSGTVRNSLDASYRRKYDTYLGQVTTARDRALKIVRQSRSPR